MKHITFYKYVEIEDAEAFVKNHLEFCKFLDLRGKIHAGMEGINGSLSGEEKAIENYMESMKKDPRFNDIDFKISEIEKHAFGKMFVRLKKEIVSSGMGVNIKNKAPYIEAKELKKMLDNDEDVVLIDVRNSYEHEIGHFENAVMPKSETYREWPSIVESQLKKYKDKKIITYCTGGVRCEKATAYLKGQGFKDVSQLHGGIIKYGIECSDSHWKGKCFVFDDRRVVDLDPNKNNGPITQCVMCKMPSSELHNCAHVKCDRLFTACPECLKLLEGCCSRNCRNIKNRDSQREIKTPRFEEEIVA